jgi:hypothetical protein
VSSADTPQALERGRSFDVCTDDVNGGGKNRIGLVRIGNRRVLESVSLIRKSNIR